MTISEFVSWAQGYYGPYPEGQRRDVIAYLKDCAPSYLDALKSVLVLKYSSRFGKVPDVAAFEEFKADALDIHSERVDPTFLQIEAPKDAVSDEEIAEIDWEDFLRDLIKNPLRARPGA